MVSPSKVGINSQEFPVKGFEESLDENLIFCTEEFLRPLGSSYKEIPALLSSEGKHTTFVPKA